MFPANFQDSNFTIEFPNINILSRSLHQLGKVMVNLENTAIVNVNHNIIQKSNALNEQGVGFASLKETQDFR